MKLPICLYGDPILRKKAEKVQVITNEIRSFINDLKDTVIHHRGLGLAATQVGKLISIFVINYNDLEENPTGEPTTDKVRVFINPVLSEPTKETWSAGEGCLSIPKVYANVTRPVGITVTYMDIDGNTQTESLIGWPAKAAMHENDHLNGVLFIDRISDKERNSLEPKIKAIKKRYQK